jgi:hypothetical protein
LKKYISSAAASPAIFPTAIQDLPNYVLDVPQTKITTLENGMRIASEDGFGETGKFTMSLFVFLVFCLILLCLRLV